MKIYFKTLAVALLALTTITAAADCTKAATPIDKTVCQTPDLSKLDAELNHLYNALRPQLTVKAKASLLTQQRAWLAQRNKVCATGDPACLRQQYGTRLDQLQAVTASASAAADKLNDVTPVFLKGTWKVTGLQDPVGEGHTNQVALKQSLESAQLPPEGGTIKALPGNLCTSSDDCGTMAWDWTRLADVVSGAAVSRYLKLSPSIPVLEGTSGSKESYYLIIPRPNGIIWAIFALCGPAVGQDCRQAAQVWTPASPDASIYPPQK